MARDDFFAFVRRRHGRSHPEYPKLIHFTDELCGNFLPFHKADSWAGPQQQQQRHRTHSPAAIKHLFECLHVLQSIQSLLFAWVDLFTGLPIKERCRLYSLYIIVKLIAFCLGCDVENGWSCHRTGFFFYIVTFLLPFPACWSREKVRVFSLSFLLFLVGHGGAKSTATGVVTNINYSFIPLRCDGSRALVLCMLGHRHRSVERESSLVLSDPPVPILISCGKPLLSLFLFFLSSWFDCLIEASSTSQIQWQRVSGSIRLTGECHLHMNQ